MRIENGSLYEVHSQSFGNMSDLYQYDNSYVQLINQWENGLVLLLLY